MEISLNGISMVFIKASSTKIFVQIGHHAHIKNGKFVFCKKSRLFFESASFYEYGIRGGGRDFVLGVPRGVHQIICI